MSTYKTYPNTPDFNETPNGVTTTFTFDEACVLNTLVIAQGSMIWTDFTYTDTGTVEFGTAPPTASGGGALYILSGWFGEDDPGTGAYCSQSDLTNRKGTNTIIRWTTSDEDATTPDSSVVGHALTWATNEINSALMKKYDAYLPFTASTLPGVIRNIATTFACYLLSQRDKEIYDDAKAYSKEYDEARARLQQIATGETALQLATGTILTGKRGDMQSSITDAPIYSRSSMYPYAERRY